MNKPRPHPRAEEDEGMESEVVIKSGWLVIIAFAAMVSCERLGDIRDAVERVSPPPARPAASDG